MLGILYLCTEVPANTPIFKPGFNASYADLQLLFNFKPGLQILKRCTLLKEINKALLVRLKVLSGASSSHLDILEM